MNCQQIEHLKAWLWNQHDMEANDVAAYIEELETEINRLHEAVHNEIEAVDMLSRMLQHCQTRSSLWWQLRQFLGLA